MCTNLNGNKAARPLRKFEVNLIKKHVFSEYQEDSIWFPAGICVTCVFLLQKLSDEEKIEPDKRKTINLKLPDNYLCDIPIQTRSKASSNCQCQWCKLARMNGLEYRRWQK